MTKPALARLTADALEQSWPAVLPPYDRSTPAPIVHIGMGAFARAHLATYADELLRQGRPAMIRAISLHSTRAADQLGPQNCLFTVNEREPDGDPTPQVIGSVAACGAGTASLIAAMLEPATTFVTLTITENGYGLLPGDRLPRPTNAPVSAPGVIAQALGERRRVGLPPPVIAAMDNLLNNGQTLRDRVLTAAGAIDSELAAWIATDVAFPNSVVDRMVPATTDADIDEVAWRLDLVDQAAVIAERHRSWVITDCIGLPPLTDVGVEVVPDVAPYERRKLWLLNAPHSALAYTGLLAGHVTIAAATEDPVVRHFVSRLTDDILAVAELPTSMQAADFAAASMQRFSNPALGHTCIQVGADGSQKLPQRLLPVAAARLADRLPVDRIALVIAAWLAAASGLQIHGVALPTVADPGSDVLRAAADNGNLTDLAAIGLGPAASREMIAAVAASLGQLREAEPMELLARS